MFSGLNLLYNTHILIHSFICEWGICSDSNPIAPYGPYTKALRIILKARSE